MAAQLRCRLPSAAVSDRHQLAGNLRHIAGSSSISLPYSSPAPAAFLSLHLTRSANPSLSQTISSPDLASLVAAVDAGGGGGLVPPGGSGKGGGGGGDDRAGPDPEPSDPDGFFDILLGGWRSRVAADPQFPFKVLMEELVGVTSCVLGDMASRPNFGLNELDFVFSTLVVGSIVNFVLMYLLAPTAASSTAAASAFPSYMFEIGPYSPLARVGTFVYKGVMFAAVGFAAGLAGTAISNGLIALRKKLDPEFETPNAPPSTVLNAVTWAIHMGISSNFRYQALNGVEYVMERALPAAGFKASVVVLRCLNNVVGGMSFVVLARMTGSQKSEAEGEVTEKLIVAAGDGDSEEEFKGADDADENYCEANLQLLFTVVESAPSEVVRSNCTVALADLAARFPNLLEPWTENMYARLRDPSTFVRKNAVLTACSHVGLVDEGGLFYNTMEAEYGITPTREHCSCVIDLLARAGRLQDAERFIDKMEFEPDVVMWKTLLAACKVHKNVKIGKRAAEGILWIDPSDSSAYILLCNIYASCGCWDDVARIRKLMKINGVRKSPGKSSIEVSGEVNVFIVDDWSHPEAEGIHAMLEILGFEMTEVAMHQNDLVGINDLEHVGGEISLN